MKGPFHCPACDAVIDDIMEFYDHIFTHKDIEMGISLKDKLYIWFWELWREFDFRYLIEIIAGIIINIIVLAHLDLSFWEKMIESFCFGIVLTGLLRNGN